MRVILYPRVSSKKQLEQGDSIKAQINRLTKFCEERGYQIVGTYTDGGKSASIKDEDLRQVVNDSSFSIHFNINTRPGFKRLLQEASEDKFDAIVFFKWDRYSRDVAFAELSVRYFEKFNIKLIPSDDSEDLFVSSIMRVVSKEEVRKMQLRVKIGRQSQFDRGIIVGRCPFGYKPIFKDKEHKRGITRIDINPKEAEIVKSIFNHINNGKSISEVAKIVKMGYQSVKNILLHKVYCGYIEFEGQERKGLHEPLISEELWRKVWKKI